MPVTLLKKLVWIFGIAIGGFIVLSAGATAMLQGNLLFGAGLVIAAAFVYWYVDEISEAATRKEAAEGVADRAEGTFGGLLGGAGAAGAGLLAIALTAGGVLIQTSEVFLSQLLTNFDVTVLFASLGAVLGVSTWIDLPATITGVLAIVVLLIAVMIRKSRVEGSS